MVKWWSNIHYFELVSLYIVHGNKVCAIGCVCVCVCVSVNEHVYVCVCVYVVKKIPFGW